MFNSIPPELQVSPFQNVIAWAQNQRGILDIFLFHTLHTNSSTTFTWMLLLLISLTLPFILTTTVSSKLVSLFLLLLTLRVFSTQQLDWHFGPEITFTFLAIVCSLKAPQDQIPVLWPHIKPFFPCSWSSIPTGIFVVPHTRQAHSTGNACSLESSSPQAQLVIPSLQPGLFPSAASSETALYHPVEKCPSPQITLYPLPLHLLFLTFIFI